MTCPLLRPKKVLPSPCFHLASTVPCLRPQGLPNNALKSSPIDGLIRSCLLEELSAKTSFHYVAFAAPSSRSPRSSHLPLLWKTQLRRFCFRQSPRRFSRSPRSILDSSSSSIDAVASPTHPSSTAQPAALPRPSSTATMHSPSWRPPRPLSPASMLSPSLPSDATTALTASMTWRSPSSPSAAPTSPASSSAPAAPSRSTAWPRSTSTAPICARSRVAPAPSVPRAWRSSSEGAPSWRSSPSSASVASTRPALLLSDASAEPVGPGTASSSLRSICLKELYNGQCFAPLIAGFPNLKTLKLFRCSGDWAPARGHHGGHPRIDEIHLEKLQVSDRGLTTLSSCIDLKVLHLIKTPICIICSVICSAICAICLAIYAICLTIYAI